MDFIKTYTLNNLPIYEVNYGGQNCTDECFKEIIDHLSTLISEAKKTEQPFGVISIITDLVPSPKKKSYGKKITEELNQCPNLVSSIIINDNIFLNILIRITHKDGVVVRNLENAHKLMLAKFQ